MKMIILREGTMSTAALELYLTSQTRRDNRCLYLWKQIMKLWILRTSKTIWACRSSLLKIKSAHRFLTSDLHNSFMQGKLQSFIINSKIFAEKWYLRKNNRLPWSNKNRYLLSKKSFKIFKTRLASWWTCRWNTTERGRSKRNSEKVSRLKEIFSNRLHLQKYLKW